ncbi:XRE family transcriptional regulator [Paenibacillus sp. H1-7]|uniref:helix-turn-helix domain-containing protein n=1 Tax=Paenibacillus sp. H1-7 TaxID=2282849 RepID=UPI001EF76BCC|nr:helix-turn-helix transcriptional regulator [Paenibacillus sp. H1-7]ULL17609.1 XRE family transcriptional regulator [Paenibacillus sp. H1-7]
MVLNRLTELRKSKRWSIQYTADRLGIAKSTYAGYESGYREPSLEAIRALADLFETSIDYVLGRVHDPKFPNEKKASIIKMDLLCLEKDSLILDGKALTPTEVKHLVAFIRTVRGMEGE